MPLFFFGGSRGVWHKGWLYLSLLPKLCRKKFEYIVDASGQDEDFVLDKDDGGSPTDDSGEDHSDGSVSGDEKEVSSCHAKSFFCQKYLLHLAELTLVI